MGFCIKCGERWKGLSVCHCTGCHRTFKGVLGFDRHRKKFTCLDPADIGMEMNEKGFWVKPMNKSARKAFKHALP